MKNIPSKEDILNWIEEHEELAEDYERHFGVSVDKTLEGSPYIEVLRYNYLDDDKKASIGEEMTIREACDLYWNVVIVLNKEGDEVARCYKCVDGTYELDGIDACDVVRLDEVVEEYEDGEMVFGVLAQLLDLDGNEL